MGMMPRVMTIGAGVLVARAAVWLASYAFPYLGEFL
jgi:hypothetical protein